jgi:hypothetical protein
VLPSDDVPEARPAPYGLDEGPPDRNPARRRLAGVLVVAVLVFAGLGIAEVMSGGRPGSPPGSWTTVPYTGLGAWVDVYSWTPELGGPTPPVGVHQIDAMANAGVQTLFLQTSGQGAAVDVLEPKLLNSLIDRAHARHMHVVAWYLPTLVDVARDLRRLEAAAALKVDGLAVDIEATNVVDAVQRSQRVVDLSTQLRAAVHTPKVLGAITLSPVHLEVVNTSYWPDYPWQAIGSTYDTILPMAYWTIRLGDLRNGATYVTDTVDRIRADTGRTDLPIHVIGGLAAGATPADLAGMVQAVQQEHAIGGSLYDWRTSHADEWTALSSLRPLRTTAP